MLNDARKNASISFNQGDNQAFAYWKQQVEVLTEAAKQFANQMGETTLAKQIREAKDYLATLQRGTQEYDKQLEVIAQLSNKQKQLAADLKAKQESLNPTPKPQSLKTLRQQLNEVTTKADLEFQNVGTQGSPKLDALANQFQSLVNEITELQLKLGNMSYGQQISQLEKYARKVQDIPALYDAIIAKIQQLKNEQSKLNSDIGGKAPKIELRPYSERFAAIQANAIEKGRAYNQAVVNKDPNVDTVRKQFEAATQAIIKFKEQQGSISYSQRKSLYESIAPKLEKDAAAYNLLAEMIRKANQAAKDLRGTQNKTDIVGNGTLRKIADIANYATGAIGRASKGWGSFAEVVSMTLSRVSSSVNTWSVAIERMGRSISSWGQQGGFFNGSLGIPVVSNISRKLGEAFNSSSIGQRINSSWFMQGVNNALDFAGNKLVSFSSKIASVGAAFTSLGSIAVAAITVAANTVDFLWSSLKSVFGILQQIWGYIKEALTPGWETLNTTIKGTLSLAAAYQSMAKVNGKPLTRNQALGAASQTLNQDMALAQMSAFSYPEIVAAQQGVMPLALGKGATAQQAIQMTAGVASVAKLTNLAPNQVLQESRDLMQGTITAGHSQVANALGITNEDIAKYKNDADGLFSYLQGKFQKYVEYMEMYSKTAPGAIEQFNDTLGIAGQAILEKFEKPIAGAFMSLTTMLGQFVDDSGNVIDSAEQMGNALSQGLNVHFKLGPELEALADALMDIAMYAVLVADEFVAWARNEGYISSTTDAASLLKEGIEFLIDTLADLAEWLITAIDWIHRAYVVIKLLFPVIVALGLAFAGVTGPIGLVIIGLAAVIPIADDVIKVLGNLAKALWAVFHGDFKGAAEAIKSVGDNAVHAVKSVWNNLQRAVGTRDIWKSDDPSKDEDLVTRQKKAELRDSIYKDVQDALHNPKTLSSRELREYGKNSGIGLGSVKGVPRPASSKENDRAAKKAAADAKRAQEEARKAAQRYFEAQKEQLKNALEDIKSSIKKALDELENLNKQGIVSAREYYRKKSELEAKNANADLAYQTKLLALTKASQSYRDENDRQKDILKIMRDIEKDNQKLADVNADLDEQNKLTTASNERLDAVNNSLGDIGNALSSMGSGTTYTPNKSGGGTAQLNNAGSFEALMKLNPQDKSTRIAWAMQALKLAGYTKENAAGILGNWLYESGGKLDPHAYVEHDGGPTAGPSGGIAQWHDDRLTKGMQWAKDNGSDWNDFRTQVMYGIWENSSKGPETFENAARSLEQATKDYEYDHERPYNPASSLADRTAYAREAFNTSTNITLQSDAPVTVQQTGNSGSGGTIQGYNLDKATNPFLAKLAFDVTEKISENTGKWLAPNFIYGTMMAETPKATSMDYNGHSNLGGYLSPYGSREDFIEKYAKTLAQPEYFAATTATQWAQAQTKNGFYPDAATNTNYIKAIDEYANEAIWNIKQTTQQISQLGSASLSVADMMENQAKYLGTQVNGQFIAMANGAEGCVEAIEDMGKYYDKFLAKNANVVNVDVLKGNAENEGLFSKDVTPASAKKGNILVYANHVVMSDGAGGAYGNASSSYRGNQIPNIQHVVHMTPEQLSSWSSTFGAYQGAILTGQGSISRGQVGTEFSTSAAPNVKTKNATALREALIKERENYYDQLIPLYDKMFNHSAEYQKALLEFKENEKMNQYAKKAANAYKAGIQAEGDMWTRMYYASEILLDAQKRQLDYQMMAQNIDWESKNIQRTTTNLGYKIANGLGVFSVPSKNGIATLSDAGNKTYANFFEDKRPIPESITHQLFGYTYKNSLGRTTPQESILTEVGEDVKANNREAVQKVRDIWETVIKGFEDANNKIREDYKSKIQHRLSMIDADKNLTSGMKEERKEVTNRLLYRNLADSYQSQADNYEKLQRKLIDLRDEKVKKDPLADISEIQNDINGLDYLKQAAQDAAELNARLGEGRTILQQIGDTAKQSLEDNLVTFLTDGINEAKSLGEAFSNMIISILKDIQKMMAKKMVEGLFNQWFGTNNNKPSSQYINKNGEAQNAIFDPTYSAWDYKYYGHDYTYDKTAAAINGGLKKDYSFDNFKNNPLNAYQGEREKFKLPANSSTMLSMSYDGYKAMQQAGNILQNQKSATPIANAAPIDPSMQQLTTSAQTLSSAFETSSTNVQTLSSNSQTAATNLETLSTNLQTASENAQSFALEMQQVASELATNSVSSSAEGHATGGYITGAGTSTSDSIPSMLSNGEFVIKASSVRKYGRNFLDSVNSGHFSTIPIPRIHHYADGGIVTTVKHSAADGMNTLAQNIGANVSTTTTNKFNVALVRDEQEAMNHFMRSSDGQRIMLDFTRNNAHFISTVTR